MSEIKHTPLPWKMVSAPNFNTGNVYTSVQPVNVDEETMKPLAMMNGEHHVCRMSHTAAPWRFEYHRANAAFIVEACNSYYENRAALSAKDAELEAAHAEINRLRGLIEEAQRCLDGEPEYHSQGMGCGLEDRGITDRYDAMSHGWEQAMERVYGENIAWAKDALASALKEKAE